MAEQIQTDLDRYFRGMVDGNIDVCIAIEQRYDLYGYTPQMVTTWMQAEIQSPGSGDETLDKLMTDAPDAAQEGR